ncbi:MAG: hypothetical protein QM778_26500 [Myxococcales bacterium]
MSNEQTPRKISLERLRALVDSYGANLERIPESERAAVQALLASSETANAAWREAAELDALLADEPQALMPSPRLERRLRSIPEREAQRGQVVVLLPKRANLWAALAAAAALVLGVITGAQHQESALNARLDDVGDDASTTSESAALSEFGALALGDELVTDLGQFEGERLEGDAK